MEYLKVLVLMFVCVYSQSSSENSPLTPFNETSIEFKGIYDNFPEFQDFDAYWNVPSEKCKKFNISFEKKLKSFDITVNSGDKFVGDKIIILYNPGDFPIIIEHDNGSVTEKNGGIPQKGNLTKHLEAFRKVIEDKVPEDFDGLGVIDFEVWRPVFRQHWNKQVIYKNMSIELEKKNHLNLIERDPKELKKKVNAIAANKFEKAARKFMEETLKEVKKLRPNGKWGYYGFPYCYGSRMNKAAHCPPPVPKENNQISWLFRESTALYPSIYVSSNLTIKEKKSFYTRKLNEAKRVVKKVFKESGKFIPVFPYFQFFYKNEQKFFTQKDTYEALVTVEKYKMGGITVWGKSQDVEKKEKCDDLLKYMVKVFGPTLQKVRENNKNNFIKSWKPLVEITSNTIDETNEESSVGEEEEIAQKEEETKDAFNI